MDSSLNRTHGDNYYILGYQCPNEISQGVPGREHNLISLVEFLDPKDETVTRGSLYNFAMLNSPETCHLGKTIISPNW